ncbi:TRAP transporter small permease [Pelagibacterium sp.]|uniref:TRAP transporter small permease n=1 Tax=Pelagibacterium sp. TaxID=1967288 RepID=UPI003BACCF9C
MNARPSLAQSHFVRGVRVLCEAALAVIVASYAVITCAQVFYRFVLNDSLVWSEEIVRYGLLWGVMIGAGVAADRGAHIALAPLHGLIGNSRIAAIMDWAVTIIVVIFCAIMAYAGTSYIMQLWRMTSPATQIPMRYVFASLPTGATLIAFFFIVHTISGTHRTTEADHAQEHLA